MAEMRCGVQCVWCAPQAAVERPIEYESGGIYLNINTDPDNSFYDVDEIGEYTRLLSGASVIRKGYYKESGEILGEYFFRS